MRSVCVRDRESANHHYMMMSENNTASTNQHEQQETHTEEGHKQQPAGGGGAGAGAGAGAGGAGAKKKVSAAAVVKELRERLKVQDGKLKAITLVNTALRDENQALQKKVDAITQERDALLLHAQDDTVAHGTDKDTMKMMKMKMMKKKKNRRGDTESDDDDDDEDDVEELKAEFASRLASAETAVALVQSERDELRSTLRDMERERARGAEREELVRALRSEGENLSKKVGELEAVLRKSRRDTREKEEEVTRASERCVSLEKELDAMRTRQGEHEGEVKRLMDEAEKTGSSGAKLVQMEADMNTLQRSHEATEAREKALAALVEELRSGVLEASRSGAKVEEGLRRELRDAEAARRKAEAGEEKARSEAASSSSGLMRQVEAAVQEGEEARAYAEAAEERLREREMEMKKETDGARARLEAQVKKLEEAKAEAEDAKRRATMAEVQRADEEERRINAETQIARHKEECDAATRMCDEAEDRAKRAERRADAEEEKRRGVEAMAKARSAAAAEDERERAAREAAATAAAEAAAAQAKMNHGHHYRNEDRDGGSHTRGYADGTSVPPLEGFFDGEKEGLVDALVRAEERARSVDEIERKLDVALELIGDRDETIADLEDRLENIRGVFAVSIDDLASQLERERAKQLHHGGEEST